MGQGGWAWGAVGVGSQGAAPRAGQLQEKWSSYLPRVSKLDQVLICFLCCNEIPKAVLFRKSIWFIALGAAGPGAQRRVMADSIMEASEGPQEGHKYSLSDQPPDPAALKNQGSSFGKSLQHHRTGR